MALKDFTQEYQIEKRNLYVCICVNEACGYGVKSQVNHLIVQTVDALKQEIDKYNEIQVAYVYGTEGLTDVKPFARLQKDDKPYYKELCKNAEEHRMEHVFFLGMEMLEQYQDGERRLYFVTEEKLPRVNSLLYKTDDGIMMNERYAASDVKIYLCKPDTLGEDLLEEYLRTNKKNI